MRGTGPVPNFEQIADELLQVIDTAYKARYRASEGNTFGAIKRAVDHALDGLRARGMVGLADRITNEIAQAYHRKHHNQRMPALPAFQEAGQEVLERLKNGELVIHMQG